MPSSTTTNAFTTKADFQQSHREDPFQFHDYFNIDDLLEDDHKMARSAVRDWVKAEVSPIIEDAAMRGKCPTHLFQGLAEIGAFGPSLPVEYGGGGMDEIAYGVIMQELERGDSGIRSMASVQGSLVMYPIWKYANEATKRKYLPKLGSGEFIGCFGLTEPDAGSNPSSMRTNIVDDGDAYILNGAKMWITNSPVDDLAVVWAKDEEGKVRGMVVEAGWKGFSAPEIHGKWSLRASVTGELVFEDVRVPKENVFPDIRSLRGPLSCLSKARYGIAWGSLGAAETCWHAARDYTMERSQFGRPLAATQLVQLKLADMQTEISLGLQGCLRAGRLMDEGREMPDLISLIKRNSCGKALEIARAARDMLGGNGISGDFPVMR
ncbi:MAG: acyl-CoA dehydrogenase family protein, partial [Bacteroidota bacterium]